MGKLILKINFPLHISSKYLQQWTLLQALYLLDLDSGALLCSLLLLSPQQLLPLPSEHLLFSDPDFTVPVYMEDFTDLPTDMVDMDGHTVAMPDLDIPDFTVVSTVPAFMVDFTDP